MSDAQSYEAEIETALLDAELFVKYGALDRAIKRLQSALTGRPRSVQLPLVQAEPSVGAPR